MGTLIFDFFEVAVHSCLMVIIVLALRLVFRRASRSAICLLWIIVGVRLAIFIPIESNYALMPRIMQNIGAVSSDNEEASLFDGSYNDSRFQPVNDGANLTEIISYPVDKTESVKAVEFPGDAGIKVNSISRGSASVTEYVLFGVWLAGFLGMLTYGLVNYLRLRKRLATAVKDADNNDIFYTEFTSSAFVYGIRMPRIYVGYSVGTKALDYVIAHEREHIRRRDHLIKMLGYLLLSIYWFAPWIWLAFLLLCKDMELACDEGVISSMEAEERAEYAEVLLRFGRRKTPGVSGVINFGEVSIKERIKSIMNYRKKTIGLTCIVLAVLALCIVILVPVKDLKATEKNSDNKEENNSVISLGKDELSIKENYETDDSDRLIKYYNIETGELFIPDDVEEIESKDIFELCYDNTMNRPVYIKVDEANEKYDSRNDCNAIIETATGRLLLGCENTVIPNTVTEIGEYAFARCSGITEVTMPEKVSLINKNAFCGCKYLRKVSLSKNTTEIGAGAFSRCGLLSDVSLPDSLSIVGEHAFAYCGRLSMVNIPKGIIENGLGEGSFTGCYSLPCDVKKMIIDTRPEAYKLNQIGDDLSNVEYHFREEAPEQFAYPESYYYGVLDSIDQFGNIALRVVNYSESENKFYFTGESKIIRISDNCKIIVRGKTEKSEEKLRYITKEDLDYICTHYMVTMDSSCVEEIIMHEYVYPFICEEVNNELVLLRENA
ncbi:MAG: leucine-rich repeat protein [Lachnospiraceae bacterium]|nr:leucine-rich repeat protein [Lachnospiraceae bacterium]